MSPFQRFITSSVVLFQLEAIGHSLSFNVLITESAHLQFETFNLNVFSSTKFSNF